MKKNQYSVSIAMGILAGAVVALFVGNTTTAILVGVIASGITGWMCSLQWGEARQFAVSVADRIDVKEMTSAIANFLSFIKGLITSLATDVNERKRVGAVMVLTIFSVENIFLPYYLLELDLTALRFLSGFLVVWTIIESLFLAALSILIATALLFNEPLVVRKTFLFNWYHQLREDNHGALAAIAQMLYIRTGNTLRIIAYPFVLIPWGFVALANNKTGIAALSAMALSGAHLSIAYFVGGIDAGNVNFWLSLAIAAMAGVAIGKKIGEMREEGLEIPPLPAIRFRHQVELSA